MERITLEGAPELTVRVHQGNELIIDAVELAAFIRREREARESIIRALLAVSNARSLTYLIRDPIAFGITDADVKSLQVPMCGQHSTQETSALCPHGMPLAENVCGPCSEGKPNTWRCTVCNLVNPADANHCRQCEYSRTVMRDGKKVLREGRHD